MTDIVEVPAAPMVPPFPALGSLNFNEEVYAAGIALPGLSSGIHAIGVAAHVNATAAQGQAQAAATCRAAAVSETTAIKAAAVSETTAIKAAAVSETTAIKAAAMGFRDEAALSAQAAQSAADFVGRWTDLSGPLAPPATAWHSGKFWVLLDALSSVAVAEPGMSVAWSVVGSAVPHIEYDDRFKLRSTQAAAGDQASVGCLGLFVFASDSDEPDDDETCFAGTAGCWLLQSAHPDLLTAWQMPDDAARDEALGCILRATVACSITTVAAAAQATFVAAVPGAEVGCAVLATPLGALDARLSVTARVTGAATVAITLNNPSAAATTAGGVPAGWQITVFKEF